MCEQRAGSRRCGVSAYGIHDRLLALRAAEAFIGAIPEVPQGVQYTRASTRSIGERYLCVRSESYDAS